MLFLKKLDTHFSIKKRSTVLTTLFILLLAAGNSCRKSTDNNLNTAPGSSSKDKTSSLDGINKELVHGLDQTHNYYGNWMGQRANYLHNALDRLSCP
ncbi:MAG TPA: hypothetical protein VKS21_07690 [Spirochaetota bacterium]|nr:hypothetical protein [Spirochaetota bacterium]